MLVEHPVQFSDEPMSEAASAFVEEGRSRFKTIDCFDFVPSNYELVWRCLSAMPRGRFCEWGSGLGIVAGLSEMLGFDACGIEIDAKLAHAGRRLLNDFGLNARIVTGDYLVCDCAADVYFVYCWPSKIMATEARFEIGATVSSKLLICWGQSDIRCKVHGDTAADRNHP